MQKEIYCRIEDILEMQTTKEIPSCFSKGRGKFVAQEIPFLVFDFILWRHFCDSWLGLCICVCICVRAYVGGSFPDKRRRELSQTTCLWVKTSACICFKPWSSGCDLTEPGRSSEDCFQHLNQNVVNQMTCCPSFAYFNKKGRVCSIMIALKYKQNWATDPNYENI